MAIRIRKNKAGLPPGSVIFTGQKKLDKTQIHHLVFDEEFYSDDVFTAENLEEAKVFDSDKVNWFDIRGIHDTTIIEKLGARFEIHNLVLEDVADTHQRPKFDEYDNGVFALLKALHFNGEILKIQTEQVAIYFKKNVIISFQEDESDLLKPVRERIKNKSGRIRSRGPDYLCYAIMDAVVDHYYVVLDAIEEKIENIEERLLSDVKDDIRSDIHRLKKEVVVMRKSIGPLREAIGRFSKAEHPLIDRGTNLFVRDLYDHTIQIMDSVETYRDGLNGLQDLYISEISLKMNQVMQVLTIITSIFVPLSFLAGIYGMNFEYMPELNYRYGYFVLLGAMFLIFLGALYIFRRNKWL